MWGRYWGITELYSQLVNSPGGTGTLSWTELTNGRLLLKKKPGGKKLNLPSRLPVPRRRGGDPISLEKHKKLGSKAPRPWGDWGLGGGKGEGRTERNVGFYKKKTDQSQDTERYRRAANFKTVLLEKRQKANFSTLTRGNENLKIENVWGGNQTGGGKEKKFLGAIKGTN